MADISKIKEALKTEPYVNLYDLANGMGQRTKPTPARKKKAKSAVDQKTDAQVPPRISPDAALLAHDIVSVIDSVYKNRVNRLGISVPRLTNAKDELMARQLVIEIWLGKILFLAPTVELYNYLGLIAPYKRNVSTEHAFLVLVAKKIIETDPAVAKTAVEVSIGKSGRTIDLVAYMKDGLRQAFEITLSSSNVTENAAKMIGKGFSKITFICRDDQLRKSVATILKDADFKGDFASTLEVEIFRTLIHKNKNFN